jgi:hypothetical protein
MLRISAGTSSSRPDGELAETIDAILDALRRTTGRDWRLTTSDSALGAFRQLANDPWFNLGGSRRVFDGLRGHLERARRQRFIRAGVQVPDCASTSEKWPAHPQPSVGRGTRRRSAPQSPVRTGVGAERRPGRPIAFTELICLKVAEA